MTWIDPGEFGRGAAAREDARTDRERAVLEQILTSGWNRTTAAEARRLHEAVRQVVEKWLGRCSSAPCDETALGLVGEASGKALAEWWPQAQELDERTRRLVAEVAGAAAAMAMVDGYLLGAASARGEQPAVPAPAASPARQTSASGLSQLVPAGV